MPKNDHPIAASDLRRLECLAVVDVLVANRMSRSQTAQQLEWPLARVDAVLSRPEARQALAQACAEAARGTAMSVQRLIGMLTLRAAEIEDPAMFLTYVREIRDIMEAGRSAIPGVATPAGVNITYALAQPVDDED